MCQTTKWKLLVFFSKLHGTVYFLYNDIASIDIDFDRCVFSSSSFFSFFVLIYIDTTSISFFLRSLLSLLWKCAYIFWTSYFLKLYPFFLFKTFDFSSFFLQNKKQKEQKNINDVTYLFYLVHNDKLCVFVYVWLGVQCTVSYLTDIITKINVKKKVRFWLSRYVCFITFQFQYLQSK